MANEYCYSMVAKSRSINNLRRVVMLAHNVHVHYSGIINLKDVFEATEKLKGEET